MHAYTYDSDRVVLMATGVATKTSSTRPLSTDARRWSTLSLMYGHIQSHVDRQLTLRSNLKFTEFEALRALGESEDGELRIQFLADAIGLDQSSASRLVARLQAAGLTERRNCSYDKRGVYIGINTQGRETLDSATEVFEAALKEGWNSLPDPKAGKTFRKAISTLPIG